MAINYSKVFRREIEQVKKTFYRTLDPNKFDYYIPVFFKSFSSAWRVDRLLFSVKDIKSVQVKNNVILYLDLDTAKTQIGDVIRGRGGRDVTDLASRGKDDIIRIDLDLYLNSGIPSHVEIDNMIKVVENGRIYDPVDSLVASDESSNNKISKSFYIDDRKIVLGYINFDSSNTVYVVNTDKSRGFSAEGDLEEVARNNYINYVREAIYEAVEGRIDA